MATPQEKMPALTLGDRVREARQLARIGSKELSAAVGKHKQYISNIELGTKKVVGASDLVKIAGELAGRGRLIGLDKWDVFRFLVGEDEWDIGKSSASGKGTMVYAHSPADLRFRERSEVASGANARVVNGSVIPRVMPPVALAG